MAALGLGITKEVVSSRAATQAAEKAHESEKNLKIKGDGGIKS
jgi:hypothetical protein